VLDLDRLDQNIATLASHARQHGYALRPVAKIHKSVAIAKRQMAAGALGQACATLAEAGGAGRWRHSRRAAVHERRHAGQDRTPDRAERARGPTLLVAVDSRDNVDALADGQPRQRACHCGCWSIAKSAAVAPASPMPTRWSRSPGTSRKQALVSLTSGIQAYCGTIQALADFQQRQTAAATVAARARVFIEALRSAGLAPAIVSGGGTGTYAIDPAFGLYTECQAGTYVFMDANYADVDLTGDGASPFAPALFVRTTVIGTAQGGFCITDAGRKEFARDGLAPRPWSGAPAGARYSIVGDDMGRIDFAEAGQALALGTAVECLTPHAYATLNLYPVYHCVRGDTLVDIWPVDARLTW
jgi:3-hydroxy-D-aspartate aldolase